MSPILGFQLANGWVNPTYIQTNVSLTPGVAYALRFMAARRPTSYRLAPDFKVLWSNNGVNWNQIYNNNWYDYNGLTHYFYNQIITDFFVPDQSNVFIRFRGSMIVGSTDEQTFWFAQIALMTMPLSCSCNENYISDQNNNCVFQCPLNSYCYGTAISKCPPFSTSPVGSNSISQCSCLLNTSFDGQSCSCPGGSYSISGGFYTFESKDDLAVFNSGFNVSTWVTDTSKCKFGRCVLLTPSISTGTYPTRVFPGSFSTSVFLEPSSFSISFWYFFAAGYQFNSDGHNFLNITGSNFVHTNTESNMLLVTTSNANWMFRHSASNLLAFHKGAWNSWNHLVIRFSPSGSNSVVSYFMNSQSMGSHTVPWGSGPSRIQFFGLNMYIDELAFFSTVLSTSDISKLYTNTFSPCQTCPSGSFCTGGVKSLCPANTTSVAGSSSCVCTVSGAVLTNGVCACPLGKYLNGAACLTCPSDFYCPSGSLSPIACDVGFVSLAGSVSSSDCQRSTISVNFTIDGADPSLSQSQFQGALPDNVALQSYKDELVVIQGDCQKGYYCPADTTTPIPCPAGTYNNFTNIASLSGCVVCPQGSYCPLASIVPTSCAAGSFFTNTGAQQQSDCAVCTTGNYCPLGSISPTNCTPGTYNPVTNQSSTDACLACPVGQYCPVATTAPTSCAAGSYRGSTGAAQQADCTTCPSGNYCPIQSVNPTNCTPGTYNPTSGGPSFDSCLACPTGQYCPLATTTPTSCAAGTYRDTTNATQQADCPACPAGNYCPIQTTTPTACAAGSYRGSTGAAQQADCTSCPSGNYCPSQSVNPTNCSASTYNPTSGGTSPANCLSCPAGQYCPLATTTPTSCAAGSYRGSTGAAQQSDCTTCPTGNYCPIQSIDPTNCSAGTYNPSTGQTSSASCASCPAGDYCPTATTTPELCSANTFSLSGAPTCSACPTYSTSPIASANCTCDPGHYHSVDGSNVLSCLNCSAGTQSSAGQNQCTACGLGYFSPAVSSACTICPLGTKCNSTTTPAAIPCGPGSYQASTGASYCDTCPVGQYCASQTTSTPTNCLAGTYNPVTGGPTSASCLVCATGKYSLAIGSSTDCPACAANSYCTNPTTIAACPVHTSSPAGSSSLLHCRCDQGFRCAYTKRITAVVTLNTTITSFNSDLGGVKTAFLSAVASAAGVSPAQVKINNVVPKLSGRRLLGTGFAHAMIDVHAAVDGAERLHNLAGHLAKHNVLLHQGHVWEENHTLMSHPIK